MLWLSPLHCWSPATAARRPPSRLQPPRLRPLESPPPNPRQSSQRTQALLGTWASDLSQCSDAGALTVITEASYQAKGKSCDISLAPGENGSFTTQCGGDKLMLTPVFAPTGEGVHVVVGDGKRQTVFRCGR